jgi:PTS system nitrogen regulatory IIA component
MKLTIAEAAALLDADLTLVHAWIEDESLPAQRVGGQYRINRTELLEWATERALPLAPRVFADIDAHAMPSIAAALHAGGIHYDVPGDDVTVAVRRIIADLPVNEDDREALLHFVVAREHLGLKVVTRGIAIPQVRTPAVIADDACALSLSFLAPPLNHHRIDTIFFLVSPTVHAHLLMLAKLTACLRDQTFLDVLERRATVSEIAAAATAAEERAR